MGGTQSVPAVSTEFTKGYDAGREESTQQMTRTFSAVAAQVYDGVHGHLEQLQTQQLDKSKQLTEELKGKLAPFIKVQVSNDSLCSGESELLTTCLRANAGNPLVCSSLVEAYKKCGTLAAVNKG